MRGVEGLRWRALLHAAAPVLAFVLIWFVLVVPGERSAIAPHRLLRIPVEGLLLVALFLVLPARAARILAVAAGAGLGLMTALKLINGGFYETLDRPAHLVTDGPLVGSGLDYLSTTFGRPIAVLAVVLVVVLLAGVIASLVASAVTVQRVVRRHRMATARPLSALAVVWALATVFGMPVADRSTVAMAWDEVAQARGDLQDRAAYEKQLQTTHFVITPQQQMLGALHGKDVILVFVESFGKVAIQDPEIAPGVTKVLAAGDKQLAAAGFGTRSAFLTSPTFGGGSWLAHSTLLSGTWVNSSARYTTLLKSSRTTLVHDFADAGWTTVATMPGTLQSWPQGAFYGYDRINTGNQFGYRGPHFGWSPMPDQFTLSWVAQHDLVPPHPPTLLEIELTSSHHPWSPLPVLLPWNTVGDGSVYGPIASKADPRNEVWHSVPRIKDAYGQSVQYSLSSLFSFLKDYGGPNTVMVFLGDHQPAPVVSGNGASRDVPVTIVAHDLAVLDQVSSWGWQPGLDPSPAAPVWRMDTFRDRFLSAFSATVPAAGTP